MQSSHVCAYLGYSQVWGKHVRQWKSVVGYWARLSDMPESRVNKRIALWANGNSNASCKSSFFSVRQKLTSLDLLNYCNILCPIVKYPLVKAVYEKMMSMYEHEWIRSINNVKGKSGKGRNKLRRYCTYKQIFCVEKYCLLIMPPKHRSALSKFRCGVAPTMYQN